MLSLLAFASERTLSVLLLAMRRGDWIWRCLAQEPSVSAEVTKQFWKFMGLAEEK